MELEHLRSLLDELNRLPRPPKREANLFSIGARGHYENPTSDLLAFFLDPAADHNLDTLVLDTLLECLPEGEQLSASLVNEPQREVATYTSSRLDLLLVSEEWVMAIENKIWHQQNNPFADYEKYLETHHANKRKLLLVLSPSGKAPSGWCGVAYQEFLKRLSPKLGQAFVTTPFNKWLILLREFLLHLESLMTVSDMPLETGNYVLSHLGEIQQIQDLKNRVVKNLQDQCVSYLEQHFSEQGFEIQTKIHTWFGYPALRFYFNHWETASDVVLFLDGREKQSFAINYYACGLNNESQLDEVKGALNQVDCIAPWTEGNGTIACFKKPLKNTTPDTMFAEVARHLEMMDKFEKTIRTQWL